MKFGWEAFRWPKFHENQENRWEFKFIPRLKVGGDLI